MSWSFWEAVETWFPISTRLLAIAVAAATAPAVPDALSIASVIFLTLLVGFITGEGLYWARLSAAATMAALPVVLAGWLAQNKLVRGLSFGAIK